MSRGFVKRFIIGIALYPATVLVGWILTSLSEHFEKTLEEFDIELGLDD